MAEAAREGTPLTVWFVRQLHGAITRDQETYTATDTIGRVVEAPLHHGQWKTWPNHVRRPDGTFLEYTPPDQVQPQMERLVELYQEVPQSTRLLGPRGCTIALSAYTPLKTATGAWRVLAHCSACSTATQDAPLVVDRRDREGVHRVSG